MTPSPLPLISIDPDEGDFGLPGPGPGRRRPAANDRGLAALVDVATRPAKWWDKSTSGSRPSPASENPRVPHNEAAGAGIGSRTVDSNRNMARRPASAHAISIGFRPSRRFAGGRHRSGINSGRHRGLVGLLSTREQRKPRSADDWIKPVQG